MLVYFYIWSLWNVVFRAQHISAGTSHLSRVNRPTWPVTAHGAAQVQTTTKPPHAVNIVHIIVFKPDIPKQGPGTTTSSFPSFVKTVSTDITTVVTVSILRNNLLSK